MKRLQEEIDNKIQKEFGMAKWLRLQSKLILAGADNDYINYMKQYIATGPTISVYA